MHYCLKHAVAALLPNTAMRAFWPPTPCIYLSSLWCTHTHFTRHSRLSASMGEHVFQIQTIKDMRTKAVMVVLTNLCQQSNLAVTVHWHRINLVCEMCAMSAQAWASSNILPTKIQNLSVLNLHSFAMIVWLQRKTSTDWSLAAFVSSWSHANH